MTADARLELALPRILEDLGSGPDPVYAEDVLGLTSTMPQRRVWSPARAWPSVREVLSVIAAIVLLVLAVVAGAIFIGSQRPQLANLTGPAGNGLIAYVDTQFSDLYLADPTTGESRLIYDGSSPVSEPMFSPDGSRIAFGEVEGYLHQGVGPRAAGWVRLLVVRSDGSDPREIAYAGEQSDGRPGLGLLGWTPDGSSLLVSSPSGVAAVGATGDDEPRDLPQPMPAIQPDFPVPTIERVASIEGNALTVSTADGARTTVMIDGVTAPGFASVDGPIWSPDLSKLAFSGSMKKDEPARVFVVDADGTHLRQLSREASLPPAFDGDHGPAWSPDGSMVAFERTEPSTVKDRRGREQSFVDSQLVVVTVATGEERPLADTRMRHAHEGWSWSPDGRHLLVLGLSAARLTVVDVDTGRATRLPWPTRIAASWQRTPLP